MAAPKLRFKEFDGNWKQESLKNFAIFSKGKGISKADISEDGINLCIRYGELYTTYGQIIDQIQSKTNVSKSECVLSKAGDVIIPASGETQIDIATASCVLHDDIILSGDLNILSHKENGQWLAYYLSSAKKLEIAQLAQGNSVVHLYSSQLKELEVNKPTIPEQTKIATFLSSVDDKISQLTKKHELLSQYKQGMMQKLFSQQIRFKADDGSEFGEWEETELGKHCQIKTGKLDANAMKADGEFRFYTCAKEFYFIDEYAFDTEALLISGNGANVGYIHYYKGKFNAYQRTYVLDQWQQNIVYIQYFLEQFLKERIYGEKKEGNTPYIVLSTLSEMSLLLPCLEEQSKIANFLSAIDQKIDVVAQQIEQAKQWKKGLLQQMFV